MTDDTLEREALVLFEALLDVPEAERDAWLAERTQGRPDLASRLAAMRDADRRADLRTGAAVDAVDEAPPPERIGAYKITSRIGRGGMGSVYRGERDAGDFAHVVAIKIIKPGLLSETLVERFQRERQTLASLSHPNIAQLYDGGATESGSPYIIMEHIEGLPILAWIEAHKLDTAGRQRLFADICAAVAFANRSLVVHRDLTPSNVLVTGEGVVKLIDFGISRPVDDAASPSDRSAPSIAQLSLTPGYAAPERMISAEVTTAADVYSLGKLLEKVMAPEMGDAELAAIAARATARDPAERYPTADSLAADVDAWRRGFPVSAVPQSGRYVLGKFVGRHRTGVAASLIAVALLLGALVMTGQAYARAETARRAEAARFDELRRLARFMIFDLNGRLEHVAGNTRTRALMADRAQAYLSALAASRTADTGLRLEAAGGLVALARTQGVPGQPNLGQPERAEGNLREALRLVRTLREPPPEAAAVEVSALAALAMVEGHAKADQASAARYLTTAESSLNAVPPAARTLRWHMARRQLRQSQAEIAQLSQQNDRLLAVAGLIEREVEEWPAEARQSREAAFDRANANYYRGVHAYFTDRLNDGVDVLRQSDRQFEALQHHTPNDPVVLFTRAWNAYIGYGNASDLPARRADAAYFLETARQTIDRLLPLDTDDNALRSFAANIRQIQSQSLSARGQHAEALAIQREVIALHTRNLGPQRNTGSLNRLAIAQVTLAGIARAAGDRAGACEQNGAALATVVELQRRGALLSAVGRHRAQMESNIALCARGAPASALAAFG